MMTFTSTNARVRENKGFLYTCIFGVMLILVSIVIGFTTLPSARTASSGVPHEQVSIRMEGTDTIVDIRHVYNGMDYDRLRARGSRIACSMYPVYPVYHTTE
ncbi:MAG: hypothetical protein NWE83_08150 [Candidatus Bathyarchaeota archaeon]|nr:hypothetical protein [Candidatus Bathyarchaeota archaeon]